MWADINREPKRTNRFLTISNLPVFTIQQVTLPKFEAEEVSVHFISHEFKFPGKPKWQDVSMTLVDAVANDNGVAGTTSNTIMQMIRNAGYQFPDAGAPTTDPGNAYVRSFSKQLFNAAVGEVGIQCIDANGDPIDQWTLHGSWIKSVEPGELSMEKADILNVKLTFVYDWADYRLI